MPLKEVREVCRLCRAPEENVDLFDIFEENFELDDGMSMCIVISIATGVEVKTDDVVSRKICLKCFKCTTGMVRFRQRAQDQNKYQKDKYAELLETLDPESKETEPHSEIDVLNNAVMEIRSVSDGASPVQTRSGGDLDVAAAISDISIHPTVEDKKLNVSAPSTITSSSEYEGQPQRRKRKGFFKRMKKFFAKRT